MKKMYFYVVLFWASVALWGVNPSLAAQDKLFPEGITAIEDSMFIGREDLTEVVIPEGVTSIGTAAFAYCKNLVSVKLPSSLVSISKWAFYSCGNLEPVEFPAGLTSIGQYAFMFCEKITTLTLPENLQTIEQYAFVYCSLSEQKEMIIPDKVTEIGYAAFGWAPFTRVKLGKSVAALKDVFLYCPQLEAYEVNVANPNFCAIDGVLFTKDKRKVLHYPASKQGVSYTLPDEATVMSGNWPFYQAQYLEVVDINHVTTVEDYIDHYFGGASVESTLFLICDKLSEIKVAEDNTAFSSVDGVLYNKQKDRLEAYPAGNKRETYTIPEGVTSVRYAAFNWGKHLVSVTLPSSIESLGGDIFINNFPLQEIHMKGPTPPALGENELGTLLIDNKYKEFEGDIYVPEGALSAYSSAEGWSKYASQFKEEAKAFEPGVLEATDSTLSLTWQPVAEATAYILDVYRDAELTDKVATYTFDANGQLLKTTDFSYTVEGLKAGTAYYIETTAVKQSGSETTVLARYTVEAKTSGIATSNENIATGKPSVLASNGQIIVRTTTETSVCVYDFSGHCLVSGKVNGYQAYPMPQGFYIVVAGNARCKVIVR